MNQLIFLENRFARIFRIALVFILLFSSLQFYNQNSASEDINEPITTYFYNQAINSTLDCLSTKTNIRLLPESFTQHFYSYDYCVSKLAHHPKIFTIVSETFSEMKIRNSTFLISHSTTST